MMDKQQCISLVTARSGGRCERCDGIGQSFHHRKKKSQGGDWTPSNIVRLCGHGTIGCHGWVEANPNDADKQGYHVRPWEDAAEKPVYMHKELWALLDDDGGTSIIDGEGHESEAPEDSG